MCSSNSTNRPAETRTTALSAQSSRLYHCVSQHTCAVGLSKNGKQRLLKCNLSTVCFPDQHRILRTVGGATGTRVFFVMRRQSFIKLSYNVGKLTFYSIKLGTKYIWVLTRAYSVANF